MRCNFIGLIKKKNVIFFYVNYNAVQTQQININMQDFKLVMRWLKK